MQQETVKGNTSLFISMTLPPILSLSFGSDPGVALAVERGEMLKVGGRVDEGVPEAEATGRLGCIGVE